MSRFHNAWKLNAGESTSMLPLSVGDSLSAPSPLMISPISSM
jgi:hypothetical protein